MNCNLHYCSWINPNWVNDSFYEYQVDHAEKYLELQDKISKCSFESFEQLKALLKDFTFFPVQVSRKIVMQDAPSLEPNKEHHLIGLLYLTKFEDQDDLHPFTAEQEKIIETSAQTDKAACLWLNAGGIASIVLTTVGGVVPQYWSAIPNFVGQGSGCLATGKYPDLSSNASNTRQNIYHDKIQNMYQNMGYELFALMEKDPVLARKIAEHLNIEKIQTAIERKLWSSGADSLLLPLKEAKAYILTGATPTHTLHLRNALENRELRAEIQALKKLLAPKGDLEMERFE